MSTPSPSMATSTPCQVFISYASKDAARVVPIAQALERAGVSVWRDGDRILGGQYYGEQIVHALAHSRVVLLVCSPESLASDNVHREVLLTWDYYHRRYVPVWIAPPGEIPERFRYCLAGCQWIDAHAEPAERWLAQLLCALQALGVVAAPQAGGRETAAPPPSTGRGSSAAGRGPHFKPGDRPIADWELLSLLGKGGFGEVWKAHNPDLPSQPPVALKFYLQLDDRGRQLLRHEADIVLRAQRQVRHDGIVPLLHAYLNSDPPCLEYPYVEGGTLLEFLDQARQTGAGLAPAQVEQVVGRIAQIVAAAHRATPRLVHRDLKPANVLLEHRPGDKRLLRVTDFGIGAVIARPLLEQARSGPSLQGNMGSVLTGAYTPLYASPQQVRGDKPDPRDDVYALGVIWYQLLTGDLASPAPTGRRWTEPLRHRGVSEAAIDLLASCFESDPAYRPEDAGVLAERVTQVSRTGAVGGGALEEWPAALLKKPVDTDMAGQWAAQAKREEETVLAGQPPAREPAPNRAEQPMRHPAPQPVSAPGAARVVLLYKRSAQPDEQLLRWLEKEFTARGHEVFVDRHLAVGMEWAAEIARRIREADAVVPLLSAASERSEMLSLEVETAHDEAQKRHGKPRLLPVRVNYEEKLLPGLAIVLDRLQYFLWKGPEDNHRLMGELMTALHHPPPLKPIPRPEGAVPLDSQFYIVRPTDQEFQEAIGRQDSVVLIRGARQVGKTSLLARGLQQARAAGARVVLTDFQKLNASDLESVETFFRTLGEWIADELDLKVIPGDVWLARRGPSVNFERYMRREVLEKISTPLVWALDEVDRLFVCPFGSEVFGLFRSWYNARVLDPTSPWARLTLAIAYATEAHLFITDMNQSPFNVGTRLALEDFTQAQVGELNHRYGSPLRTDSDVQAYHHLLGGHPYLVNRGLYEMVHRKLDLGAFRAQAERDDGVFGDHLRRILVLLAKDPQLCDVVRGVLRGRPCPTAESFYRLRSGGVMAGDSARDVRPRCQLYASYLERHLQ